MYNVIKNLITSPTTSIMGVGINPVGGGGNTLVASVTNIVNGIIAALGIVCVVVMLIGGINYMTSAGDTNKIEKGKKTIIYGLVGLAICALSFAIVNFVIYRVIGDTDTGTTDYSQYKTSKDCKDNGGEWDATKKTCEEPAS